MKKQWISHYLAVASWLVGLIAMVMVNPASSEPRGFGSVPEGAEWFQRTLSLRDLGFENPLRLDGPQAEQQLFFPVPEELVGLEGNIEIIMNGGQALPGVFSGRVDLGGRIVQSFSHKEHQFDERITTLLDSSSGRGGFADLTVRYGVAPATSDCVDPHLPGNYLQLDERRTRLTYRAPLESVHSIRAAWTTLPHRPVVWLPAKLDANQYLAAVRIGLLLNAAGMEPQYQTLPLVGSVILVEGLKLPESLAKIPRIARLLSSQEAVLNEAADIGAWLILNAFQENGLIHFVIDADQLRQPFTEAIQAIATELPPAVAQRAALWQAVLAVLPQSPDDSNLALLRWFGQPLLAINSRNNQAAIDQLASAWRRLAGASSQQVNQAQMPSSEQDTMPLTQLKSLPTLIVGEQGAWDVPFTFSALPVGKAPVQLTLRLIVAPAPGSSGEPVASVLLNGYLLRGTRLTAGEPGYLVANIPRHILSARNLLRIQISRGTRERCQPVLGTPAQILPASRIDLGAALSADRFGGLAGAFAHAATLAVPAQYIETPLSSLPFIVRLGSAIGLDASRIELQVAGPDGFTPTTQPFLAIGTMPNAITTRPMLRDNWIDIRNSRGQTLYSARQETRLALAQLVRVSGQTGVVVELSGIEFPVIRRPLTLDRGDFAILDDRGVALEISLADPPSLLSNEDSEGWREWLSRYHGWLMLGAIALAAIGILRVLRAWFRYRAQRGK